MEGNKSNDSVNLAVNLGESADAPLEREDGELLPCPFCGGTDVSDGEVLTKYPNGKLTTQSMCNGCKALGAEAALEEGEVDYGSVKAIAAWNRRSPQAI